MLTSSDACILHTCTLSQVQDLILPHHDRMHETVPPSDEPKSLPQPSMLSLGSHSALSKHCSVPNTAESAGFDQMNGP